MCYSTPGIQGTHTCVREKSFWMSFPYCIWHYGPVSTPPTWPRLLKSRPLFIPDSSFCLCTRLVLLLIVWFYCSLSSLASSRFLCRPHFLSHLVTHIFTYRRVCVCLCVRESREIRKSCINMCLFCFILLSQDMGDILPNLPAKRKNCQIVFLRRYAGKCSQRHDFPSFLVPLNYVALSVSGFSKLNARDNRNNRLCV